MNRHSFYGRPDAARQPSTGTTCSPSKIRDGPGCYAAGVPGEVLPDALASLVSGYRAEVTANGWSTASVQRLTCPGRPALYLKVDASGTGALQDERDRIAWCSAFLPVPQIIYEGEHEGREYLVTSALDGQDALASLVQDRPERVVRVFGAALGRWHALPIEDCPFDMRLDVMIGRAADHTARGLVDEDDFDRARQGRSAASLLDELRRLRPAENDLVVCHGDYTLDNVVVNAGQLSGFIDLGRCGISDRYRDLAIAARDVRDDLGDELVPVLWEAYKLETPDEHRLAYYRLLDEFF